MREKRILGIGLTVCLILAVFAINAQATYKFLGVDDQGQKDSQFFTADCWSDTSTNVGPLYNDADIEAFDSISLGGTVYAVGGEDNSINHPLYTVDFTTGAITEVVADLNLASEAQGGSFKPGTSLFWIAIQNSGISYIDVANSYAVTTITSGGGIGKNWEGLAWQNDSTLYGITDPGLLSEYSYNGSTLSFIRNIDLTGKGYEGMEFDPDGNLIASKGNLIYQIDLTAGSFGGRTLLATYNTGMDVESFTFVPEPATLALLALGGMLLRRKR